MTRSSASKRPAHGCRVADDHDESTNIIRQRLSGSPKAKTAERQNNSNNAQARKSTSFYHIIIVGALAYYVGYLQGKVERFIAESSDDDLEQPTHINNNLQIEGSVSSSQSENIIEKKDEDTMLSAVTTLRCLATPGCYPRVPCAQKRRRPTKISVLRHWEEHSFCAHDLLPDNNESPPSCLVYSFGLYDSIEWEAKMASTFRCEVFAFDPTSKFNSTPAPGVHFYKLGLKGVQVGSGVPPANDQYGAIDPSSLYTLGEIIDLLSHQHRNIDVLRLDCEGCEYGVLNQLACGGGSYSHIIKQLMVEFHWQKSMGLASDKDLIMGAEAIQCLEKERWGLVSLESSGIDPARAQYIDSALRVIKDPFFALYATFRRIPPNEMLPWQVYKVAMEASWNKEIVYKKYMPRYGDDILHSWPDKGVAEWNKTEKIFRTKLLEYSSLYAQDLTFDTFRKFEGNWEKWK